MKNSLKVAGLMSGTSMDGLDCCIADVSIDSNFIFDYNIISQKSFQFNQVTKNKIRQYIGETKIDRLNEIDKFMGESFLNLSNFFLSNHSFDYIAIHGQTIHHKDKILITLGAPEQSSSKIAILAQDKTSNFGKILEVSKENLNNIILNNEINLKVKIHSMGHRNPQGIAKINDNIFSVEHGPRGGDELNKISKGNNYGWPNVSYGTKYLYDN